MLILHFQNTASSNAYYYRISVVNLQLGIFVISNRTITLKMNKFTLCQEIYVPLIYQKLCLIFQRNSVLLEAFANIKIYYYNYRIYVFSFINFALITIFFFGLLKIFLVLYIHFNNSILTIICEIIFPCTRITFQFK